MLFYKIKNILKNKQKNKIEILVLKIKKFKSFNNKINYYNSSYKLIKIKIYLLTLDQIQKKKQIK